VFPPQTDDFQKPIKFMSTLGNVLFGKESENLSEEKPVEKPSEEKPVEKPSGEKSSEQPQPKPKPKLVRFHYDYCGRDGHKGGFCLKRKREERMTKEWAKKDKYHPSNGVLEPRVQMPKAKAIVRTVLSWGERKAAGGAAGRATQVRPVRHTSQTGAGLGRQRAGFRAHGESQFGSGGRGSGGWSGEFLGGQFARRCPPRAQYGDERSRSFEVERRNGPRSSFVVLVLLQLERVGSLIVVTMVVFVELALIGSMFWIVLTPLWSKWPSTGSTLLVLTPVLSCLFAHVLVLNFRWET
jgi:hypothetical protein